MSGSTCPRCRSGQTRLKRSARSSLRVAEWVVPSALLALMPKCPACVAAYLALATGVGLSFTAATYLRATVIVLCAAMLSLAAWQLLRAIIGRTKQHT